MIVLFWVLNFVISAFNSWSVGREWAETRIVGGPARFFAWCGAVMSAVGFTWCILVPLAWFAGPEGFHKLPEVYVQAMLDFGYLVIIGPAIGSGIGITIQSWMAYARNKTFGSGAVAGYNTFADLYNIGTALEYVPDAWSHVSDILFGGKKDRDEDENVFARIAIILVILAAVAGCLLTAAIIQTVSQSTLASRRLKYQIQ